MIGRLVVALLICAAALPSLGLARASRAGTVDRTFGARGLVALAHTPGDRGTGQLSIASQRDGRILVTGESVIVRLTSAGKLDRSFGHGGVVREQRFPIFAMVVQRDGRILVGGTPHLAFGGPSVIGRLTARGVWDRSFGNGGFRSVSQFLWSLTLDARQRILAAGEGLAATHERGNATDVSIVRLTSDGSVDPSFGAQGTARTDVATLDHFGSLIVLRDGRQLVSGWTQQCPEGGDEDCGSAACSVNLVCSLVVVRYSADGQVDPSFAARRGSPGLFRYTSLGVGGLLAQATDGSLRLVGARNDTLENFDTAQVRLGFDGDLDLAFGVKRIGDGFSDSGAEAILPERGGKLLALNDPFGGNPSTIARLTRSGTRDRTFGHNGSTKMPNNFSGLAMTTTAHSIVIVGLKGRRFAVMRLHR